MQIPLRQKLPLYIIGISSVVFFICLLIIRPTIKNILTLRNDIYKIQQELEQRHDRALKTKRSLQELETIKKENVKFIVFTVQRGDELKIITELENLAQKNNIEQNLDLAFIDEKEKKAEEKSPNTKVKTHALPQYFKFSFLNNGFFLDHVNYLRDLEKLPYYLIINNLNWEKSKTSQNNVAEKINLRFEGIIYVQDK